MGGLGLVDTRLLGILNRYSGHRHEFLAVKYQLLSYLGGAIAPRLSAAATSATTHGTITTP
eukprot:608440-Pyramimonas_sp.AAC.1